MDTTYDGRMTETRSPWGAVICLSLMTFTLVASEFMPVSLLTPIAQDLAITEGQVGMPRTQGGHRGGLVRTLANDLGQQVLFLAGPGPITVSSWATSNQRAASGATSA